MAHDCPQSGSAPGEPFRPSEPEPEGTGDAAEERAAPKASDEADEMGCLGNTPGESSQIDAEFDGVAGEDWFEWNLHLEWDPKTLRSRAREFEAIKKRCQELRRSFLPAGLGDGVTIGRQGRSKGKDRGTHYEFVLNVQGVEILVANRHTSRRSLPNARAIATGRDCLLLGVARCRELVLDVIERLGAKVTTDSLSRLDLALDLPGVPVTWFCDLVKRGWCVGAEYNYTEYRKFGRVTGCKFGADSCQVKMYDKVRERLGKSELDVLAGLVDRRWNGVVPHTATRIEFQLRREHLTDNGIDTLEDYDRLRGSLVEQLVTKKRLTARPFDRESKQHARAGVHPLWVRVQELFTTWAGEATGTLDPIPRLPIEPWSLVKQAFGCLRSVALRTGERFETLDDACFYIGRLFFETVDEDWLREYELEASRRADAWEDAA